jgi:DNA primase
MEEGSSASTLYTNALFKPARVVAVVEGILDTLALQSAGIPAVAPASGAAGWSDSFPLLFRGKRVVVVADNDEPGLQYGTAIVESLETAGIPTIMATVPVGKDVGEFAAQFSDWRERTQVLRALWESWLNGF